MPRAKGGPKTRQRRKKVLKQAKGYVGGRRKLYRTAAETVLRAGAFAYKIKKPVQLGFLDFTTLEARHFYCCEELRLNRRLAPALYLDVVAITGTPEQPCLDMEGQVIEYAVKMAQFEQDQLASRLIKQGRISALHIEQLAQTIARFHEDAAAAAGSRRTGRLGGGAPTRCDHRPVRAHPQAGTRRLR